MSEAPKQATVLDTSVLSNFAYVDRVALLLELPRVVTVEAVRSELVDGIETHPYLERSLSILGDVPVVQPGEKATVIEQQLLEALDPGEAQVLAVAEVTDGTAVTDDGDARGIATERAIPVTGSIGLLVRFVDAGSISTETADSYLKQWIDEAGFRSPSRDIEEFL